MLNKNKILTLLTWIFSLLGGTVFLFGFFYLCIHLFYGNLSLRQFLFHTTIILTMNLSFGLILIVLLPLIALAGLSLFVIKKPLRWLKYYVCAEKLKFWVERPLLLSFLTSSLTIVVGLLFICGSTVYSLPEVYKQLKYITAVIFHQEKYDTYFEENYANPTNFNYSISQPHNLIVIFAESLEKTFLNAELFSENLLPELSSQHGSSFLGYTDHDEMNWTKSALTAALCGINSKIYLPPRLLAEDVPCIPEVLNQIGFQTYYLQGTSLNFAYTKDFLTHHGFQIIEDIEDTRNEALNDIYSLHFVDEVQSDSALLAHFQRKITQLAKQNKPFLAITMTMNMHPYSGHLEKHCPQKYHDMRDVILCMDHTLSQFTTWFLNQDFASNSTLVILGDHLMIYSNIHRLIEKSSQRETLNLIWGHAAPKNNIDKPFYQVDWAPTFLQMTGVTWQNNRWGLGTSLLSTEPTLYQKHGKEGAKRLLYNSKLYEEKIVK